MQIHQEKQMDFEEMPLPYFQKLYGQLKDRESMQSVLDELHEDLGKVANALPAELLPGGDTTSQELRVNSVQVTRLLQWIADTQRDLRVRATTLEIERTKTPEMVSARIRFERPPVESP
jgi:hypothetical protein